MKATFKVQHDVLSGLKYLQIVKRKGMRVGKEEEMIVSRVEYIFLGRSHGAKPGYDRDRIRQIPKRSRYMRRNVS